jgi:hypothetical protein
MEALPALRPDLEKERRGGAKPIPGTAILLRQQFRHSGRGTGVFYPRIATKHTGAFLILKRAWELDVKPIGSPPS